MAVIFLYLPVSAFAGVDAGHAAGLVDDELLAEVAEVHGAAGLLGAGAVLVKHVLVVGEGDEGGVGHLVLGLVQGVAAGHGEDAVGVLDLGVGVHHGGLVNLLALLGPVHLGVAVCPPVEDLGLVLHELSDDGVVGVQAAGLPLVLADLVDVDLEQAQLVAVRAVDVAILGGTALGAGGLLDGDDVDALLGGGTEGGGAGDAQAADDGVALDLLLDVGVVDCGGLGRPGVLHAPRGDGVAGLGCSGLGLVGQGHGAHGCGSRGSGAGGSNKTATGDGNAHE